MRSDIVSALDSISQVLTDRGLERYASDVTSTIKGADSATPHKAARDKLSSLSKILYEKGYDALGRRLLETADKIKS